MVITQLQSYKYLGLVLNEFLDYGVTCKTIAQAASRALGLLVAKCKANVTQSYITH